MEQEKREEEKMEGKTIPQIIEEVKEAICDEYCKYVEQYDDQDNLMNEKCQKCHLVML